MFKSILIAVLFLFGLLGIRKSKKPEQPKPVKLEDKVLFHFEDKGSMEKLEKAKDCGFNVIHTYNILWWTTSEVRNFFDMCKRLGLEVIPSLASCFTVNPSLPKERAIDFVKKWRGESVIYSWYILDEPNYMKIPKAAQEEAYKLIKGLDPTRPISIAIAASNSEESYRGYFTKKAFDILFFDLYPFCQWNTGGFREYMKQPIETLKRHFTASEYPVIPLIQTFYDTDLKAFQKPNGHIRDQYDIFCAQRIAGNIACYCWRQKGSKAIDNDKELFEETKVCLAAYK